MTQILRKSKSNLIALEIIDFQNNTFGLQLETIVSKIKSKIDNHEYKSKNLDKSEEVEDLSDLIYKRTGIRIKFNTTTALAAVLPFYSNKHHIFIHKFFRGQFNIKDQEALLKESNDKKGYVDLKNAKVGGIFSEYEVHMYMNFTELFTTHNFLVPELVAVMLHELGHAFYACEYSDRLESSNQILTNLAKYLTTGKQEKDLTYVYKEFKKINDDIKESEVESIVTGTKVIAGYHWFKAVIGTVKTQMKYEKYDETSFEQVADNFAARFGYGRQIIQALEKLGESYNPFHKFKYTYIIDFFAVIAAFAITGFSFTIGIPIGIYYLTLLTTVIFFSGTNQKDLTYDELKDRYIRIRNEYVEMLKETDLPNEEISTILSNIYAMDEIVKDTGKYKLIFNRISDILFKSNREASASIKEQQLLEDLAFNDLFLMSSELKTLSS